MKLQRLNVGFIRGKNAGIDQGIWNEHIERLALKTKQDAETTLIPFLAQAKAINSDAGYTPSGKAERIAKAQEAVKKQLESIDPRPSLQADIKRANAEVINAAFKARGLNRPKPDGFETIVQAIKDASTLSHFQQMRIDAPRIHAEKVRAKREAGIAVTDEEAICPDPLEVAYLQAMENYSPEAIGFIRAVEAPPYGVKVLSDETLAKGEALLQQAVAGEHLAAIEALQARYESAHHVFNAALDILMNPSRNEPISQPHILQPDSAVKLPASAGPPSND